MTSIFARLTDQQEQTAEFWQTKRLKNYPAEVPDVARVAAVTEKDLGVTQLTWAGMSVHNVPDERA